MPRRLATRTGASRSIRPCGACAPAGHRRTGPTCGQTGCEGSARRPCAANAGRCARRGRVRRIDLRAGFNLALQAPETDRQATKSDRRPAPPSCSPTPARPCLTSARATAEPRCVSAGRPDPSSDSMPPAADQTRRPAAGATRRSSPAARPRRVTQCRADVGIRPVKADDSWAADASRVTRGGPSRESELSSARRRCARASPRLSLSRTRGGVHGAATALSRLARALSHVACRDSTHHVCAEL